MSTSTSQTTEAIGAVVNLKKVGSRRRLLVEQPPDGATWDCRARYRVRTLANDVEPETLLAGGQAADSGGFVDAGLVSAHERSRHGGVGRPLACRSRAGRRMSGLVVTVAALALTSLLELTQRQPPMRRGLEGMNVERSQFLLAGNKNVKDETGYVEMALVDVLQAPGFVVNMPEERPSSDRQPAGLANADRLVSRRAHRQIVESSPQGLGLGVVWRG